MTFGRIEICPTPRPDYMNCTSIFILLALIPWCDGLPVGAYAHNHPVVSPRYQPAGKALWENIRSAEDLLQSQPGLIASLFEALDSDRPGLEKVHAALTTHDTLAACHALIEHYAGVADNHWIRAKRGMTLDEEGSNARALNADSVTFNGVTARVPRRANGGWEWRFTGPNHDQEFGYSLNGHRYLLNLQHAWRRTGDKSYVATFDKIIRDWIIHNPLPAADDSIYLVLNSRDNSLDWRDIGEVRWRDLEAGQRLGESWPQLFYAFQNVDAFTPAARLLMLASVAQQAEYLRTYHKRGHNWTTMEMNGLALAGLAFPEFRNADRWSDYALEVMSDELSRQVYPDGVQKELSTKTQWVALSRFESLAQNFHNAGRDIPDAYMQRLEDMYNYLAYCMRPDGHQPLNNDSDREDLRARVITAAKKFERPDWIYVATNGKEGRMPDSLPSVTFPWAGIHIMRNNWSRDAHWAIFDNGAFGTGHQHADKLHLSVSAFGRDLLVDGGRYTHENYFSFDPSNWRGYFRSSFSHNVLHIDGKPQNKGPITAQHPLTKGVHFVDTEAYDYASGTFSSGFENVPGEIEHRRDVMYLKDKYWIVVDRIHSDRPRKVQALWHYAPDCTVSLDGTTVTSTDPGKGNVRIIPADRELWEVSLVKGQTTPVIQGWYSETYGKKEPNSTAIFSTDVAGSAIFVWLLVPARGTVPMISFEAVKNQDNVHVRIKHNGKRNTIIFPGKNVPKVK